LPRLSWKPILQIAMAARDGIWLQLHKKGLRDIGGSVSIATQAGFRKKYGGGPAVTPPNPRRQDPGARPRAARAVMKT
jgi:hypothetical protein